ncbi:MAG: hypothetical protein GY861_09040 [bacterium]|nr:hypothetical protein [bacterium]
MKKKAQANQIFTYIFVLIVIAVIMVFGAKAIAKIVDTGEDVQMSTFKKTLKNDIEKLSGNYGSIRHLTYSVPGSVTEVCFYDHTAEAGSYNLDECPAAIHQFTNQPLIKSIVSGYGTNYDPEKDDNTFIMTDKAPETLNIDNVDVGCTDLLCVKVNNGRLSIHAVGKGAGTFLFYPNYEICNAYDNGDDTGTLTCSQVLGFIETGDIGDLFGTGYYAEACEKEYPPMECESPP